MIDAFGLRGLERGQGRQRSHSLSLLREGSRKERGRQGRGSKGGSEGRGQMVHRGRPQMMHRHRTLVDEDMGVAH